MTPTKTSDLPLFARRSNPETSQDAMAKMDRKKVSAAVDAIVRMLTERGPMADWQQAVLWPTFYQEPCCDHLYRQARSVARDMGKVRATVERRQNPNTGRMQVVWEVCNGEPIQVCRCPTCGGVMRKNQKVTP